MKSYSESSTYTDTILKTSKCFGRRCFMAEILPIRRYTLPNLSSVRKYVFKVLESVNSKHDHVHPV